jgi:hypothetical protein
VSLGLVGTSWAAAEFRFRTLVFLLEYHDKIKAFPLHHHLEIVAMKPLEDLLHFDSWTGYLTIYSFINLFNVNLSITVAGSNEEINGSIQRCCMHRTHYPMAGKQDRTIYVTHLPSEYTSNTKVQPNHFTCLARMLDEKRSPEPLQSSQLSHLYHMSNMKWPAKKPMFKPNHTSNLSSEENRKQCQWAFNIQDLEFPGHTFVFVDERWPGLEKVTDLMKEINMAQIDLTPFLNNQESTVDEVDWNLFEEWLGQQRSDMNTREPEGTRKKTKKKP